MANDLPEPWSHKIGIGRYALLLAALLLFFVVTALSASQSYDDAVDLSAWSLLVVAGLVVLSSNRRILLLGALFAIPWPLALLLSYAFGVGGFGVERPLAMTLFLTFIASLIVQQIFASERVTTDILLAGVNLYLLSAVIFTELHLVVELLYPGAYVIGGEPLSTVHPGEYDGLGLTLLYFSFTSLTTLGYGDVQPTLPLSRMLSSGEAVFGQLFIAILIARLVSSHALSRRDATD